MNPQPETTDSPTRARGQDWQRIALFWWAVIGTTVSAWLWVGGRTHVNLGGAQSSSASGMGVVAKVGLDATGEPVIGISLQLHPERPAFPEKVRGAAAPTIPVFVLRHGDRSVLLTAPAEWSGFPEGRAASVMVRSPSDSVIVSLGTTTSDLRVARDLSLVLGTVTLPFGQYKLVVKLAPLGPAVPDERVYPFELRQAR